MPTIVCPHCSGRLRVPDRLVNRDLACPLCGKSMALDTLNFFPTRSLPPPAESLDLIHDSERFVGWPSPSGLGECAS